MMDSPYPGLNPFREEDSGFFFGREPERDLISANLTASRLTLLYGPSGVGKSSVLNAGVIAQMRRDASAQLAPDLPTSAVIAFRRWQSDPTEGLLRAIHEQVGGQPPVGPLRNYLEQLSKQTNTWLYIILDQFEEYFLYQAANDGDFAFAAELAATVNSPRNRANFLISIREDALAKLDLFKGRIESLFDNYLRIEHLAREAAQAAVEEPVKQFNLLHPGAGLPAAIEDGLAKEILDQLAGGVVAWDVVGRGTLGNRADAARIEAPYLQLVLRRLWNQELNAGSETLRLATLKKLGGCTEIVKKHLDEVLREFSSQDRDLAAGLFHHLVTPSGAKIAHTIPDLSAYVTSTQEAVEQVVRKLAEPGTRILREVASAPGSALTRYEIFHDALAPAVLDWRRRQQNERQIEGQRIRVSAFEDAITSGLQEKRSPEEVASFVKEQVQKLSAAGTAELAPGTLSGRRLLWVDDRPNDNLYESGLFRHAGMAVTTAISSAEAKRQLKSGRFDLVISDIHRREGNRNRPSAGYELLQWMRRNNHVMPLIFYTGIAKGVDKKRSKEALGWTDNPATLVELVMRAVREDDQQKGRWGGRPVRNYRRLQATVTQVGRARFRVILTLSEARNEPMPDGDIDPGPLTGEVQFHVHQTFPNPVLKRHVRNGFARCELMVYGAFTVGAAADEDRTHLELDLALDESFPEEFRAN